MFEAGDERRTVDVALLDGGSGTYSLTVCDPSSGDELARGEAKIGAAASRPAFTGRIENLPAEHDGSVFEFAFHFSERPADGLGISAMRDSLFTTTAATVTNAERITEGSNLGWRMQVEPDGAVVGREPKPGPAVPVPRPTSAVQALPIQDLAASGTGA